MNDSRDSKAIQGVFAGFLNPVAARLGLRFGEAEYPEPMQQVQARIVFAFQIAYASTWLAYVMLYAMFEAYISAGICLLVGVLPSVIGVILLRYGHRVSMAGMLSNVGSASALFLLTFTTGGAGSAIIVWLLAVVVGTYLQLGKRMGHLVCAYIITLVVVVGLLDSRYGDAFYELPFPEGTVWFLCYNYIFAFSISALIISIFVQQFEEGYVALQKAELRYRLLLSHSPVGIFHYDTNLIITYCNERFADMLHNSSENLIGLDMKLLKDQSVLHAINRALKGEDGHYEGPYSATLSNAHIWVDMICAPSLDERGNIIGGIGIALDISERKLAENELRIAAIAFDSQDGMLVSDADNNILRVNQAFTNITGYAPDEVVGKNPRMLGSGRQNADFYTALWGALNTTGMWEGEIWNRRKNGEVFPESLSITAVKDARGDITNYVASFSDITLRKSAEEEIRNLAFYDPLTGLPNRRLLQDRLRQALASSGRSGKEGALLFIDLDNFKALNDSLGHDIGDVLLQQVALRLQSCIREGDTVARLGGDEFVVMLEDLSADALESAAQTETVGEKILATLNQPYQLRTHEHHSTPSIGATLFIDQRQPIENLLKQADIAMYQAKKAGRNTLRFFDPQMQDSINARATLEGELRKALERQQFQLYYQVQVDGQNRPVGVEALIRWIHPERGLVSPDQFIPLAEETGLIQPIGNWVLEVACIQLVKWAATKEMAHLSISVNVSAHQFQQDDFSERVIEALERTSANPERLKLELTESMLLSDIDSIIAKMDVLKERGVGFSLDDFGTGYSSLSYLSKLPLDQLKIDRSFVMNLESNDDNVAICAATISLAHSLKLKVVAEGVETETHRYILSSVHHCDILQGYLFGKPVPIDQLEASIK